MFENKNKNKNTKTQIIKKNTNITITNTCIFFHELFISCMECLRCCYRDDAMDDKDYDILTTHSKHIDILQNCCKESDKYKNANIKDDTIIIENNQHHNINNTIDNDNDNENNDDNTNEIMEDIYNLPIIMMELENQSNSNNEYKTDDDDHEYDIIENTDKFKKN